MPTLIAAVRRNPGATHQTFLHYLHHVHGSLAAPNPLRTFGSVAVELHVAELVDTEQVDAAVAAMVLFSIGPDRRSTHGSRMWPPTRTWYDGNCASGGAGRRPPPSRPRRPR